MAKKALVVGINNYTVQNQYSLSTYSLGFPNLSYSVNDADSMYHLLIQAFDFEAENITLLKDQRATRRNILSALAAMFSNAEAGDVICFYYSGHGGILPATDRTNNTLFYESIIPYQGDWIYDFDIAQIARSVNFNPAEINLTVILDSCHAGGMVTVNAVDQATAKTLPFRPDVLQTIRYIQTMWPFGVCYPDHNELFPPNVSSAVVEDERLTNLVVDPNRLLVGSANAMLIAACKYYELAYESPVHRHSYLTQAFIDTVNACPYEITHNGLIDLLAEKVRGYSHSRQTPELRGRSGRENEIFLSPWNSSL